MNETTPPFRNMIHHGDSVDLMRQMPRDAVDISGVARDDGGIDWSHDRQRGLGIGM